MKTVITTFVMLLSLFTMISTADAGPSRMIAEVPAKTIHEYIGRLCKKDCVNPDNLVTTSREIATKYDLSPSLLMAIAKVESSFNKRAVNRKTGLSAGVMQIQVRWHKKKFAGRNYFDVATNLDVGAAVLKDCMVKHKGNTRTALMCFNGYSNKKYPAKVLAAQKQINRLAWSEIRPVGIGKGTLVAMAD
jgi:soluble lytic murein transglycosylase-like protein